MKSLASRLVSALPRIVLGLALTASSACTHVAPYQRGKLAHPTMTMEPSGPGADHMHAIHEGASGGGGAAEGGCGCN